MSRITDLTRQNKPAQARTGQVKISYGVHSLEAGIAGQSVGEVRQALKEPLNIDPRALALVNGRDAAALRPERGGSTGVCPSGRGKGGRWW